MPFIKTNMPHLEASIDVLKDTSTENYQKYVNMLDDFYREILEDLFEIHPDASFDHTSALAKYIESNFLITANKSIEEAFYILTKIFGDPRNMLSHLYRVQPDYLFSIIPIYAMSMIYTVLSRMIFPPMTNFLITYGSPIGPNYIALRDLPVELMDPYLDFVKRTIEVSEKLGYSLDTENMYFNSIESNYVIQDGDILKRMLMSEF